MVQAMDAVPEMRGVLSMFEGVCTGAADGYGRMKQSPAMTLLHLGPGLGNGIANLHNARRAGTPIINVIGNHALYHLEHDAPLTSNIDTLAQNVSSWIKSDSTATSLAADGMAALQAAMTANPGSQGSIATLITPADACWGDAKGPASPLAAPARPKVDDSRIRALADALDNQSLILLDGSGLSVPARVAAGRIAAKTGCRVAYSTFPGRVDGGAGLPVCERMPYFPEQVLGALKGVTRLVLAGAAAPVSFFAYPEVPSRLVPDGCEVSLLSSVEEDTTQALEALADQLGASSLDYAKGEPKQHDFEKGKLTTMSVAAIIANQLPEGAILCGDSGGGGAAFMPTQLAPQNTWLNLTGGSIGQGGPCAVGAAVACPDRRVLALLGDGASMYTNQAFWSQAREGLDVTTVIFNNGKYGILEVEYLRLGVNEVGDRAASLFDLTQPSVDFVQLAASMGVRGWAVNTTQAFSKALAESLATPGPSLIEAQI